MAKWTKKDPGRTYISEEEKKEKRDRKKRMLSQIHHFVERGAEAEADVIEAAKAADPDVTQEEIEGLVKQFHDAVWDAQRRA